MNEIKIKCPDCAFVATGRTDEEAIQDFERNALHVCTPEPIGNDPIFAELQLRCLEHADKAREEGRTRPSSDCIRGCANGWIPYEINGLNYAKACPIHMPDWVHPDLRKGRKELAESKKAGWMD